MEDTTLGWRFVNPRMQEAYPPISLGETAECVADQFAVVARAPGRVRAREPAARGRGDRGRAVRRRSWSPVSVPGRKGAVTVVDRDEHPRPDTTAEALAALKPAFRAGGTSRRATAPASTTARRRCCSPRRTGRASWACAPMARVVATAVAGVHPDVMGIGPVPAIRKALARAGLTVGGPRRRGAQRGVREPVGRLHGRAGPGSRRASTPTAGRSPWAIRSVRPARG